MENQEIISMNVWNQPEYYQESILETGEQAYSEWGKGSGVLHTPEIIPHAQGRLTDRASRIFAGVRSLDR
jgi:hypothetical protein